jgi:hypothetical protein
MWPCAYLLNNLATRRLQALGPLQDALCPDVGGDRDESSPTERQRSKPQQVIEMLTNADFVFW